MGFLGRASTQKHVQLIKTNFIFIFYITNINLGIISTKLTEFYVLSTPYLYIIFI